LVTFEFVHQERTMTTQNVPADTSPATSTATPAGPAPVPAPPSWAWQRGALILAGAAQLITISALNSADPLAVTWASLLLAIAPAPLAAAAAFASLAKSATVPDVVVNHVKEQLVGLLDLEGACFEYGSLLGHPPSLQARLVAVTLADQAGRTFGASQTGRSVS
jgi:hypothetical protein